MDEVTPKTDTEMRFPELYGAREADWPVPTEPCKVSGSREWHLGKESEQKGREDSCLAALSLGLAYRPSLVRLEMGTLKVDPTLLAFFVPHLVHSGRERGPSYLLGPYVTGPWCS